MIELTLTRTSHQPWGLRLQGGADFEKALTISSVTEGSPSHLSGLKTGDVLVTINGLEAMLMTHKQGQEAIISAGDNVPLVVQRVGGPDLPAPPGTWRPSVQLIGGPATAPASAGHTYTKTSLAANPVPEDTHWDVKHNITAKGFQPVASSLPSPAPTGPPRPQVCWKCGKPIIGVFLQIKGRPIHAECFTCEICKCSLKNVGHFLIAEKLYCQAHAMQAQAQLQGGEPAPAQAAVPQGGAPMPQGLAANLARLAIKPQGGKVPE